MHSVEIKVVRRHISWPAKVSDLTPELWLCRCFFVCMLLQLLFNLNIYFLSYILMFCCKIYFLNRVYSRKLICIFTTDEATFDFSVEDIFAN